jgi:hypothetical protein
MPCYLKDSTLRAEIENERRRREAAAAMEAKRLRIKNYKLSMSAEQERAMAKTAAKTLLKAGSITAAYYAHLIAEIDGCENANAYHKEHEHDGLRVHTHGGA